jgi:hypothetical protein
VTSVVFKMLPIPGALDGGPSVPAVPQVLYCTVALRNFTL